MNDVNKFNTAPLRLIKIAKNLTTLEMAKHFECSSAYINAIENETRDMHFRTLKYGLDNLGITIGEYDELVEFRKSLSEKDLEDKEKFKYMLMKTIGVITPEIKEQIDEILNNTLSTKIK